MEKEVVRFIVQGTPIEVDREIIIRNDVMNAMLQSGMRESFGDILIDDCSPQTFNEFVGILSGKIGDLRRYGYEPIEVLEICRKYNETKFLELFDLWLSKEERSSNRVGIIKRMNLGYEYGLDKVVQIAKHKIIMEDIRNFLNDLRLCIYDLNVHTIEFFLEQIPLKWFLTLATGNNEFLEIMANWALQNGKGNAVLLWAGETMNLRLIRFLIDHGADVNHFDPNGNLLIHFAAQMGGQKAMEYLISCGADVNLSNTNGDLPIHIATDRVCLDSMKCLVDSRADVNVSNGRGDYPVHIAINRADIEKLMYLISHGAEVTLPNRNLTYPIHRACTLGNTEILKLLLNNGANANVQNAIGNSPIHIACTLGNTEILKLLLDHGVNANVQNAKGDYPIHIACTLGNTVMVKLLLEHGADLNLLNSHGHTAYTIACQKNLPKTSNQYKEIIDLLESSKCTIM